jgi:exonuclease SbcC
MLLHRILMKNFRRFRDAEIDFRDGITGIVGNNGAGKSSIVEAILFALYGVRSSGVRGDFIISSFAESRDRAEVRLDFSAGGHDYSVVRTFRKGKSSSQHEAQLFMGGDLLADGVSAVEKEVTRVLGMGPADFKNTIYAGQKDLLSLLDDDPASRKRWFMRVLGIDHLKDESDAILKKEVGAVEKKLGSFEILLAELDREEISGRIDACTGRIAVDVAEAGRLQEQKDLESREIGEIEKQLQDLREKRELVTQLEERHRGEEANLLKCREDLTGLATERSSLMAYRTELESLGAIEKEYLELMGALEAMHRDKERYDELSAHRSRLGALLQQDEAMKTRCMGAMRQRETDRARQLDLEPQIVRRDEIRSELDGLLVRESSYLELWSDQSHLERQYAGIEERVKSLVESIRTLEELQCQHGTPAEIRSAIADEEGIREQMLGAISALDEKVRSLSEEQREVALQIDEIRGAGREGICPTCRRPLEDHYTHLMDELNAKVVGMTLQARSSVEEREDLKSRKELHSGKISALKDRLHLATENAANLQSRYEERRELCEEAEACLLRKAEVEDRLVGIGYDPEKKRRLEAEINRLEVAWKEYLEISERLRSSAGLDVELAEITERMAEREQSHEDIEMATAEIGFDPSRYADLRHRLNAAETAYNHSKELRVRVEDLPRVIEQIAAKEKDIVNIQTNLDKIEAEISLIGFSVDELREQGSLLTAKRTEAERLTQQLSDRRAGIRTKQEELKRLEGELERAAEYEKKCDHFRDEILLLRQTRRFIGDYITYLLNVVRERIEGEVGRVLGEITDGRYENVLIDENFTVLVNDMGDNFPAHRFSGGEQDDIAISLRIALSRYLAEMHHVNESTFLIFDEIFGSQDEERRGNLIKALRTQEAHFPQIFLISHIADMHGEFSNTLLVDMGEENASRVQELSS